MQFFTHDEMVDFSHEQRSRMRRYWLRNYAENSRRLSNDKDIRSLPDLKFGRPVAVIGAAPIEDSAYLALKQMEGIITVVCCDKALPRVLPYLRPDFVCALNTQKTEAVELEKWFEDSDGMGLIVPLTVHPDTVNLWKGDVYWMNPTNVDPDLQMQFEQDTGLLPWSRGINVGEFAMHMAAFLRPMEIAMFGLWYAWLTREEVVNDETDLDNYDVVELVDDGERYWTNIIWLSSRAGMMGICKNIITQGMSVFNCSDGGILYHPEYCKRMNADTFANRWLDSPLSVEKPGARLNIKTDDGYGGD